MSGPTMASELLARLQRHYIKPGELMPGGMFLPEVTLGSRRADALYVGFFASRGKLLVGHELKVSRSDWLHELDQPAKAEVWASECHSWYVVAPSVAIVHPEELPPGWGLMVPSVRTTTRMDVVVKAVLHEERQPSWEATHALVQRADSLRMKQVGEARDKAQQEAWAEVDRQVEARLAVSSTERETQRADRAEALLAEVGELLGVSIVAGDHSWGEGTVSMAELRSSFARWLASDRVLDTHLNYRINSLKVARDAIRGAERALADLLEVQA